MKNPNPKKGIQKIQLRQITQEDFEAIIALQLKCFPDMKPWSREQFDSILSVFPEGQICIEDNSHLVASCCSLIINESNYVLASTWKEFTGNGFIQNHDPKGDTLYGMEIMVDPDSRSMKLARRLYNWRKRFAVIRNLKKVAIGGRLPNYYKHKNSISVQDYVKAVMDKKIFDPVLCAQLANGFTFKKILPDYLPSDTESCRYAVYLEWINFQYRDSRDYFTSRYVRVAVVQYQMRSVQNFEEFASHCEYFVDIASEHRSDFVMFPEMLTTQLLSFIPPERPAKSARRLSEYTDRYIKFFNQLAIKYNINIIGGTHLNVEDQNLYNIAYLFGRDGSIGKQYKIQITPHEKKWWGVTGGNKIEVFDTDCGKVAIAICYDVQFPELVRIAAAKGAEILFVPYNTDEKRGYIRVRCCAQARAIENQMYVAITGCVGNLPNVENLDIHFSQSAIFTPSDAEFSREGIATEATANTETIIYQDLDLRLLQRNREFGTVQHWRDLRTDLYEVVEKNKQGTNQPKEEKNANVKPKHVMKNKIFVS